MAMQIMSTHDIVSKLRRYKPMAADRYGVTRLGVFGSVARGEHTEDSDVDICYEGRIPSLLTLDQMQSDQEQLFGRSVDMVRIRKGMNSLLLNRINKEAIYV